jgi:hypothetical protein
MLRHTGWPEWTVIEQNGWRPALVDGGLQAFLADNSETLISDPAHADFWRAMPDGRFLLIRGYIEDATDEVAPGKVLDLTNPV